MKVKSVLMLACALLLALAAASCAALRTEAGRLRQLSAELELDVTGGRVVSDYETHGGFHGDGTTFVQVQFPDASLERQLKTAPRWQPFPLSDVAAALICGGKVRTPDDRIILAGPLVVHEETGEVLFPAVDRGYWYVVDRQGGPEDARGIWGADRHSLNFTVAVYDADTDTLYFGCVDT